MKRRNVESNKYRKQFHFRKCKFAEGMYGSSTFVYLKFLLIWVLIMIADFVLEFRFEFLWPFWLVIRNLHDSFKYQGILFSIFFILIAILSDLICYMFLPVQWLFFAASTYVWIQYVWYTEKGVCLPTVSLWLLFVYIEASFRLKNIKIIDLCRPFAAHCIGYPMVTLGFGFKSYLSYKLRLKKQKKIQRLNDFYIQLINKALPLELQLKTIKYEDEVLISSKENICSNNCELIETKQVQIPFNSNNINNNNNKDKANKSNGLIVSALSYCLNSSSNSSVTSNLIEDFPYIQQKDINNKFNNSKSNTQKLNELNGDSISNQKPNFSTTNKINHFSPNYLNNNSKNKQSSNILESQNDQVPSINCNLSSFSISSLAYTTSTNQNNLVENNNLNLNGINVNSNRNLLLLSSNGPKTHHQRSASSSNNFIPNGNNHNHTNININMTINATAIASAHATATATSNQTESTNLTNVNNSKKHKNKENKNLSLTNGNNNPNSINNFLSNPNQSKQSNNQKLIGDFNDNLKDGLINSLETDLKKLKLEVEQQKKVEQYLRNQINYITKCDRSEKLKLEKFQQENEQLQFKLNKLNTQKQKEKEDMEKRLQEEKKKNFNLETQLAQEKKLRLNETTNNTSIINNKTLNDDQNLKKITDLENENKVLKEDCLKKQEKIKSLESELKLLLKCKDAEKDLKEKNISLQESLSAETRFKMDLFSALGEARRQLEYAKFQLETKERELTAIKTIFNQSISITANSTSQCLINDLSQNELITQYLADQLASLRSSGSNSDNSHTNGSSSPSYSPTCNKNSIGHVSNDLNHFMPKI